VDEVKMHLDNMSSNCSPGYKGIHPKVLKSNPSLISVITDIFNCCIESGIVPSDWKFAILTVLFKKGDPTDMNNYRGISVLPVLAKLFEKLLADQITDYFVANNLFYSGQHGFRKGHSCETALHELLSDLNIARDLKKIVLLLFIDFRKAFDTVDSSLLIIKLLNYGFEPQAIALIKSYFSGRQQVIKQSDQNCPNTSQPVTLGVPQGSCLGPLFFLIFINDLPFTLDLSTKLFADDTTLYLAGDEINQLIKDFSERSKLCLGWCDYNRIDINWKKTYAMIVTNKRISIPKSVKIDYINIAVVDSFKLLGITIDNKLSFTEYASNLCRAVNSRLFSIKRLFFLCTSVKIQFFKSFILPYFDYCATLYIYFPKIILQKINNLFYFCLFKLFGSLFNFDSDVADANLKLEKFNLNSFQHRLFVRFSTFSWRIVNSSSAPLELKSQLSTAAVANLTNSDKVANIAPENNVITLRPRKIIELVGDKVEKTITPRIISKVGVSKLKYGELTFGKCFNKFNNKCISLESLRLNLSDFRSFVAVNNTRLFNNFISQFLKFDLAIKNFNYKKTDT
jgi:hypothetical protein